ncbi:MAG: alkaline shock response membrane anchor protein AmaP [Clostridiaceae bacterium]|jgi:uncharacterized alkaline shock family protein YloU|nr:alkaline shock response membrane anchor protein AmaP [Clostridiaceae bacterium]
MNSWVRFLLTLFSLLMAVVFLLTVIVIVSNVALTTVLTMVMDIAQKQPMRTIVMVLSLFGLLLSIVTMAVTILSGRLRKARIQTNSIGSIDIGVDAIESIALNAAKASQSGVKSAKAHVAPFKGDAISVSLIVMAYSDVEIPAMMTRVQERVKKDIERYTGIEVGDVKVRVNRVEAIAARVER